jgi:proline iminopeptidase
MIKALGPSAIAVHEVALSEIADGILNNLTEEEKKSCDTSLLSFEYAVTVISKLFTNYETSRKGYQNLANALDAFSKRMTRIVSHRPATVDEEKAYLAAISEMKAIIEGCMSSPSPYIQGLTDAGWNAFQIKSNLFFLYFAGTETTASSMNYLIWQLGKEENQALQQEIRESENGQQILLKAVAETLRIHPPAFIQGRQLREDTLMTIKDKHQNLLWEKKLRKGHSIVCLTQTAGRDPKLYPEPETFNPHRFGDEDPRIAALSFLPFGGGPHICPGQHLALAELQTFSYRLLAHFSIHTLSPEKVDQKGFFTLRATSARMQLVQHNSPTREAWITANSTKFFCRFVGNGKPCLVLHGGPGLSHDYLYPHLGLIGQYYSLIYYDQRHCGRSEAIVDEDSISLDTFVQDLRAIQKELGHEKIAVLGHSWGSLLALAYAASYPESVDQLMLISPIPLSSEEYPILLQERARRLAPYMSEVKMLQNSSKYAAKDPELLQRYDRLILGTFCAQHKSIYNIDLRRSTEARAKGDRVYETLKRNFFSRPFNLYEHLSKISCRTWIVHGIEDPHPLAVAEKIHISIRRSQLQCVENCGHFPFAEQPVAFNQHFQAFSASL